MSNSNYQLFVVHRAVSPITHMEGTTGNVAVLMRQGVLYEGSIHRVPCLTGNAMRNRMLREPGSHLLKTRLGLYGHLSAHQDRFLSSGQERSEKGNSVDVGLKRRGYELMPHMRLLGGTLPSQVIEGRAQVGFGVLCCRESRTARAAIIPHDWPMEESDLLSYQSMIEFRQYTRKSDDVDTHLRDGEVPDHSMMIFGGYTLVSGSVFVQRIDMRGCRDIDAGAACAAIELWDGTVGGQKSRGHGHLHCEYQLLCDGATVEAAPLIDAYEKHVEDHKQAAIDWLYEAVREPTPQGLASAKN